MTYYDIETGPLPRTELEKLHPFDPESVKFGNTKDPEKRQAKLVEAQVNHLKDLEDKGALSPLTGVVLAIGILTKGEEPVILTGEEPDILAEFWQRFPASNDYWVGFNSHSFDLPFVVKRSWKHSLHVHGVRKGRYWNDRFIDLRDDWQMGDRQAKGSLDAIARHLGIEGKNGKGEDFARMFQLNPEKAINYLKNDLRMTQEIHERMKL